MKFQVDSNLLSQRLQMIAPVITAKGSIPMLETILFELEGNKLTLTAADMVHRMSASLEVQNLEGVDGSFAIHERHLLLPFKELPTQPVSFTVDLQAMLVEVAFLNGQYQHTIQSADAYPQPAEDEPGQEMISTEISADALLSGISSVFNAVSTDERRPIMSGIFFDFFPDKLVFVATDGKILIKQENHNIKREEASSFSLPRKACQLLRSVLPKVESDVSITYSSKFANFNLGDYTLSSRLLEGRFPNYNSVIAPNNPYKISTDRLTLLSACRRISLFANQATKLIRLHIKTDEIIVSAKDLDLAVSAQESLASESNTEIDMTIGFDSTTLQTILETIQTKHIILDFIDQTRSVLIIPVELDEGIELVNLVQPLRVVGE